MEVNDKCTRASWVERLIGGSRMKNSKERNGYDVLTELGYINELSVVSLIWLIEVSVSDH